MAATAKKAKVVKAKEVPPIPLAEMQRLIRTAGGKPGKIHRWFAEKDGSLEVLYTTPARNGRREAESATIFTSGYVSLSEGW